MKTHLKNLSEQKIGTEMDPIYGIAASGNEDIVPYLIQLLQHENEDVASSAANLLGSFKSKLILPALVQALNDKRFIVSISVISSLGEFGDPKAISVLIKRLNEIENKKPKDTSTEFQKKYILRSLIKLNATSAEKSIIKLLKDTNPQIRKEAAEALGILNIKSAVPDILTALTDNDAYVRYGAAYSLKLLNDKTAIPYLYAMLLTEKDNFTKSAMIGALGKLKSRFAASEMIEALQSDDIFLKRAAAKALGEIEARESIPYLVNELKEDAPALMLDIIRSLGQLKAVNELPLLLNLYENHKNTRLHVVIALGNIADIRAIETLLIALRDYDPDMRFEAAKSLKKINHPKIIPEINKVLEIEKDAEIKEVLREILEESVKLTV